jgi:hypothetical protein
MKYEQLSRSERLARIGELLAKGIALLTLAEQRQGAPVADSGVGDNHAIPDGRNRGEGLQPENDEEQKILAYIGKMFSASPRELQQHLGLSKATAYRRLNRLVQANLLVRSGATKGIKYQLSRNTAGARDNAPKVEHTDAPAPGI